jgi:hypothetical protein
MLGPGQGQIRARLFQVKVRSGQVYVRSREG